MEYSIYVYGGGEILWKVFNGIALLFQSNSPYFTSVGKLTLGIGLLYAAAQAIPRASLPIFFKSWFLPTFLLVALFYGPKSSVHIIDKADMDFRYSKVDHIPIGIAGVASLATQISEYLTESVETIFHTSDAERFSKVGPMFGARLIQAAHTLSIRDPLMKENLKDFTRQCFAWPYVFSNITPGKKAALETQDMLGFIAQHPHPLLGIYWRYPDGSTKFMNCVECAKTVQSVIGVEVTTGLQSLAHKLFGAHVPPERATQRLNQYFGEAWSKLAQGSHQAAQVVQQELMLNAYREALQDKRDELRLGRSPHELAHLNATRGIAHQESSFLVKSIMAGTLVPVLHTIVFALALIYFAIMTPMTFLPRGIQLLSHWVKVMLYLGTWPVLFAILNGIGQMFAARAMATKVLGYGEGLTLLTQTGLADAAQTAYVAVMGLQLSVPVLAWGLLWGGGQAFSQLAGSLTQGAEGFATKSGAESVDGNVAFNTQSLNTRSIANAQMAQQQLGAGFHYGSRFDDGKLATLHGPGGQMTLQEHQTQLGTNVSQNDTMSTLASIQSQFAAQSALNKSRQAGFQIQEGLGHLYSVAQSFSDQEGWNQGISSLESHHAQQSLKNAVELSNTFADEHGLDRQKTFNAMVEVGIKSNSGAFGGSNFLKGLIPSLSGGVNGSQAISASDKETLSAVERSGVTKAFSDDLNHGLQYLHENKSQFSQNKQIQNLDQAQRNFSQAQTYSEQSAVSLNESQMWQQQVSEQQQRSLSSSSNINPKVIDYIANKHFGGNKDLATQWQAQNLPAYYKEVGNFLEHRSRSLKADTSPTRQSVEDYHRHAQSHIQTMPVRTEDITQKLQDDHLKTQEQFMRNKMRATSGSFVEVAEKSDKALKYHGLDTEISEKKSNFSNEEDRFLISRAFTGIKRK